jgi:hypothetical protein
LLYVEARLLAPRPLVAAAFAVALIVALPVETAYGFVRLFRVNGTSGLPMTLDQSIVFAWVDREITTTSDAVMIPYPVIRADFWSNIGFWWDLEFWNRSVDREAAPGSAFSATPSTFPKLDLRFDPRTGRANVDLDSYVAQAQYDARFHVAGRQLTVQRGVSIVFPDRPWHADWVSYGLYDDGWTRPGVTARFRVFPLPGQRVPELRTLTFVLVAPNGVTTRRASLASDSTSSTLDVTTAPLTKAVPVCVPPGRAADVRLRASGSTQIYGDQANLTTFQEPRSAGLLVAEVTLEPGGSPVRTCGP